MAAPLVPGVGFCIQADTVSVPGLSGRYYVNMVRHKLVDMPVAHSGKVVTKDHILANGIGNMSVPFDMGSFRKVKQRADGAKYTTYCVDVVFNPLMIQLFMDDAFCNKLDNFRPFMINLALKRIEESIGVTLSAQKVKLVKSVRYKDGEGPDGDIPREFTELTDDIGESELDRHMPPPPEQSPPPLIEEIGAKPKKAAIKKGFLNNSPKALYPEGSKEGVLPENAGDPMGWMPKKLRQSSKIVDCNSPEYQAQMKQKASADTANSQNQEFRDLLASDSASLARRNHGSQWSEDLPDGTDAPVVKKYENDYSRFDKVEDVEEPSDIAPRDWYYDENGQRKTKGQPGGARPQAASEGPEKDAKPAVKKGFFDNAKSPLYPKGSEQAKGYSDEQMMKDFEKFGDLLGQREGDSLQSGPVPNVDAKAPESKAPEYTLSDEADGLRLTIAVPGLESMQGVNLDVTEQRAVLEFPKGTSLNPLRVELPTKVVPAGVRAKFSKRKSEITVTLPIVCKGG